MEENIDKRPVKYAKNQQYCNNYFSNKRPENGEKRLI
jgi:hypothetical protein